MATSINLTAYSDALVVLGTAGVVVPLVRRFGASPVLGYLGAGALLGPLGLGSFTDQVPALFWITVTNAASVSGIADLGVVFLLFVIGLELSYERLLTMRRLVFGLGSLQVAVTTLILASLLALVGMKPAAAIIIGACLALSSTAIVLEVLSGQGRMATGAGRASFAVLLAQDLAVIPLLLFVSIFGASADGSALQSLAAALLKALIGVAAVGVVGRLLLRPLFRHVGAVRSSELFIAAILFVIVGSGLVAVQTGLSMALGAFVAGLLLAETEYRKAIEATIAPVKGLLLGMFFFTVGMSIDVRELAREPLLLIAAVAGLIALKAAIATALCRLYRLSWVAAVEAGLLLGPGGEFAFVGIGTATGLALIEPRLASFTLAVTSLSMALIPLLAVIAHRVTARLEAPRAADPELAAQPDADEAHAIVVGHGRVGKVVTALLAAHKVPFIATDHDAAAVARERRQGHRVYFGDAADPAFLATCGLMRATGVVITIHDRAMIDRIVEEVRRQRPDILIVSRARDADHARHLYEVGATDAVPETIEASLQLSEAALVGLGVQTGPVIASIHEKRDEFRHALQSAAHHAGRAATRSIRPSTRAGSR